MERASQKYTNELSSMFIYLGIVISLAIVLVTGLRSFALVVDYFVPMEWLNYRYAIIESFPDLLAFFIVGAAALLFLSHRANRSGSLVQSESGWGIASRTLVLGVITAGAFLTLIPGAIFLGAILNGNLSFAAFLKLGVTALVGVTVFRYYRNVLSDAWRSQPQALKMLACTVYGFIAILVVLSIYIINPVGRNDLRDTYRALEEARQVHLHLVEAYNEDGYLPATLDQSALGEKWSPYYGRERYDIDNFRYTRLGASYELCADFTALPKSTHYDDYPYADYVIEEVGETCFTRSVR